MTNPRAVALKVALAAQGMNISTFARMNGVKPPQIYRILAGTSKSQRIERNIELAITDGKLKIAEMFSFRHNLPQSPERDRPEGPKQRESACAHASQNKELAG